MQEGTQAVRGRDASELNAVIARLEKLEQLILKMRDTQGKMSDAAAVRTAEADKPSQNGAVDPATSASARSTRAAPSDQALRAKIAKLPVKMNTKLPAKAVSDDDIPRTTDHGGYQFPTLELLDAPEGTSSANLELVVQEQAFALSKALQAYGIKGEIREMQRGPVVTVYSVELQTGTRVARLESIAKDIARTLVVPSVRIVPNIAGSAAVGIEVPNKQKAKVRLTELMSGGHAAGMMLPMFMGKDSAGEPLVLDLAKMPHMLIAGAAGSGKSICLNAILASFLYTKRPDELRLVLIDSKGVEMAQFADVPHLACPVVTEMAKAAAILEWAVTKMEERYELLKEAGVRDIRSFNELGEADLRERMNITDDVEWARIMKKMPYMVFVIDELADVITSNWESGPAIVRLAQKARAVGIHVICATQRPQERNLARLIKLNMPCRVAFKLRSSADSRIVLHQDGAELLLGEGDMLVVTESQKEPRRCQGTLIEDRETRGVGKFLKNVASQYFERQQFTSRAASYSSSSEWGEQEAIDASNAHQQDELFDQAVGILIESGRGSVSLLQRSLAIGYGRASRLVDLMGIAGLLGEHKGSHAREVVVTMEEWQRMKALRVQAAPVKKGRKPPEHVHARRQDELFDQAAEILIESGRGSVSLLQRRLAIGYGRASRLVDLMGQAGLLGEHKGSQAREVVVTMEEWQRMKAIRDKAEREGTVL